MCVEPLEARGQLPLSSSITLLPDFYDTVSEPVATKLVSLAGLILDLQISTASDSFFHGSWESKLTSRSYTARCLAAETSPGPEILSCSGKGRAKERLNPTRQPQISNRFVDKGVEFSALHDWSLL